MRRLRLLLVLALAAVLLVPDATALAAGGPGDRVQPEGDDPGGGGGGVHWRQYVEELPGATKKTYASSWYTSQYECDTDADTDYVFVYNLNYQQNPDSLKFYFDDWRVETALPSSLSAFARSWTECRLCVGDITVGLAGGAGNIKSHVWIHQVQ